MKLQGVVVAKDFNYHVMDPSDLSTFTQLATSTVSQRIFLPYQQPFEFVRHAVEDMYEAIEETIVEDKPGIKVRNQLFYKIEITFK
jgi:cleavage and polyadenylation specificity factor subunit 3